MLSRSRDTISVLSCASTDSMAIVGAYATSLDEGNVGCLFPYSLAMLSLRKPPGSPGPLFPTAPALCKCAIISGPYWFERYSQRFEESRLPTGEAQRSAYAEQIGTDGLRLLSAIYHATAPHWVHEMPAVEILRRTLVYQYYTDEQGHLR